MSSQKGFTLVEGLLIVLILSVIGFAGYYVWQSQDNNIKQVENLQEPASPVAAINNETEITNASPVTTLEESGTFCTTKSDQNGNFYDMFSDQKNNDIYTYTNNNLGLEFFYPKQWGPVMEDEAGNPICVGPLALRAGIDGVFGQGDGDLITSSTGYIKDGSNYYSKWFYEEGPIEIKPTDYDVFKVVTTLTNNESIITANNCTGMGCANEATLNLKRNNYEGLGISNRRITSENVASMLSGEDAEYFKDSPPVSSASFNQIIVEIEKFVSTVSVIE